MAPGALSAQTTKAQLEVSETLFTVSAALNSCGYDTGLEGSLPLRAAVRSQLQTIAAQSAQAAQTHDAVCQFWKEHQASESAVPDQRQGEAAPYVSLALELGPPPLFAPSVTEADLPPDAAYVLGLAPLLAKFYQANAVHALWLKHQASYQSLVLQFHDPVSDAITQTDRYLRLPFSNYPGQRFAIFLEPQLAPGQVNARNYANSYLVVVSPNQDGVINLEAIRHTYLHFVLEPLALKHGASLKRLEPILEEVHAAPTRKEYKNDISLMVNESLIRAIEARMTFPKTNESARDAYVQRAMAEGFVLTHYFYLALAAFEKESTGMKDAYGDLLHNIDLEHERRRAHDTVFAAQATPEVVSASKPFSAPNLLDAAEQKLAAGDLTGAQSLAQQVVQRNNGGDEPGRAAFILARVATLSGNMQEARLGFQQAAQSLHDARMLAWSHIYLGRILDIQDEREAALTEYRAALAAGDTAADTKAAAEKGLAAQYQPAGRK